MKKLTKCLALPIIACLCVPFAACGEKAETIYKSATELSFYDGTYYEELGDPTKPFYNDELWRRADITIGGADPLVLDDTARTGYYYAYVTGFTYYYSKDLSDWTYGGRFVSLPAELSTPTTQWAPEVIYDEDTNQYFSFFTITPQPDTAMEGVVSVRYLPIVAVSDSPAGPFVPVDLTNASAVENALGDGYEAYVRTASEDYPQYYAKYALLDNAEYQAAFAREGLSTDEAIFSVTGNYIDGGYVAAIDFSPFVDPDTGDKYLYWSQTPGAIAGVKMINWCTPDWSTYKTLTCCRYFTVEDYKKAMNGEEVELVFYEQMASYCNEGPFMYKHNGKYYLTFSIGSYTEASYGVMQAVSDSPLGPFRKLSDSENGMLLSNDVGENHAVGGPGHHSFFTVNVDGQQKLMIAYHAHTNLVTYANRALRFDEVKWVTIEGKDGASLEVMHVNGPTVTTQPTFGVGQEYGDISNALQNARLVRGELAEGSSADSMVDGLFSCFVQSNQEFEDNYIQETKIVKTSTFEISLESPRELRGIMFYNSKKEETTFEQIKNIAFICEENGQEKIYLIPELEFSGDCNHIYSELNEQYYLIYGSCCYAEFAGIQNVKAIRFTVEVPEDKESVGIAEVAIVGKFASAQD